MSDRPSVLFVCVHNAGRSQMAAGYLQHLAGDRVELLSAGSEPKDQINPVAVAVMAEEGIAAHPDDVVVSCGSQQALDLVTRVFCDPGDVILAEAPSYVGAIISEGKCDLVALGRTSICDPHWVNKCKAGREDLIRYSCGLEDAEDLIDDLDQALR